MSRRALVAVASVFAACVSVLPALTPASSAAPGARYAAGGTAVVRQPGEAVLDDGSVICDTGDGVGAGGLCLPFGGGDAVAIADAAVGQNVAFQVCLDNDGDGLCTSPDNDPTCPDQIYFSHDDAGNFFNPVGPVPTGFLSGCSGGAWNGYVVFICNGAHLSGVNGHSHPATSGTGSVTSGGEGQGTFCGGGPTVSNKPYVISPAAIGPTVPCTLTDVADATAETGNRAGILGGGPVAALAVDSTANPLATVRLDCIIRVNGFDQRSITGIGTGFASTGPVSIAFFADDDDVVEACTRASVNGGPYRYYDANQRVFTDDPTAPCLPDAQSNPAVQAAKDAAEPLKQLGDAVLCPLLALAFPPEGDIPPVQDCPPYT